MHMKWFQSLQPNDSESSSSCSEEDNLAIRDVRCFEHRCHVLEFLFAFRENCQSMLDSVGQHQSAEVIQGLTGAPGNLLVLVQSVGMAML